LLQVNKDLNKKLQKLETKLNNMNDELKKTKEDLETAENTIKQYKEEKDILENRYLENKLSKSECFPKEHISQIDAVSSKQEDVRSNIF